MAILSRQDLAGYALRKLGGGVVNIEISSDQMEDLINDAVQYYQEFHFDGIERDFVVRRITGTVLTVTDVSQLITGMTVANAAGLSASIRSIDTINSAITLNKTEVVNASDKFMKGDVLTVQGQSITTAVTKVVLGDIDNRYIEVDDMVVGVIKVLNISNVLTSTEYMFNIQYQTMLSEMHQITSGQTNYYYSMMNYMGHLDFILRKEKDFRFNRRMNRIFLDINWGADINVGDVVGIEIYRALSDDVWEEILNDRWLKDYTVALFKEQWGANLKKYKGMVLPGGLQYDGQTIFDEGREDKLRLQEEAINSSAPLDFQVG